MAVDGFGAAADHAGLSGLEVGDPHPQYALPLQGLAAVRPAQPVRAGVRFLATDTGVESMSDGSAWHDLAMAHGHDYSPSGHAHPYLPLAGKAADADLFDGYDLDRLTFLRRAQMLAHHSLSEGRVRWDGSTVGWSGRVIMLGAGNGAHGATSGWLGLYQPATGTVVQGFAGEADRTVTAAGFPLPQHAGLYADVTSTAGSGTIVYKIVGYTADFVVPAHWILVAHRSEADGRLWFCSEGMLDYWRAAPFINSWANYGQGYENGAYTRDKDGFVHLRGLVHAGAAGSTIFTLPPGYRPGGQVLSITMAGGGPTRIDISSAGSVWPTAGPWIALSGVAPFRAEA